MPDETSVTQESTAEVNVRDVVRQAIEEFIRTEQAKAEPAYQAELQEERRRREGLESRLNQLVEENRRARAAAEESDRNSQIRSELQKLGIVKVDLAFRAVRDDIARGEDGRLFAKNANGQPLEEYLRHFVQENPELLPARIAGGSGAQAAPRSAMQGHTGISLEQIKPGMSQEELNRVRQEIARLASERHGGF